MQTGRSAKGVSQVAFTGAQLNQAIGEMNAVGTEREFQEVWGKWARECPALCANGTDFYKAAAAKRQSFKAA